MPSKKKTRGKARRAAKSRKVKEEDGAVNDSINSEMQQMQIGYEKNSQVDDEEALLEEAINLAAAEREELEAAAKKDGVNNSKKCFHGLVLWPPTHVCEAFMKSFADVHGACCVTPH